ncbi:citrate synthase/methylcitrate synthase [Peribacillus sp. SCS-155]|uniref:citrate synthase/methylcitrate synthase n=1 Tax=Peribacillus sedimenti TaxID=3115297 RepID=UPI003905A276
MVVQKGLKGVVAAETELSYIDGEKGILIYRGYEANKLATSRSFEEVAYLIWYGKLPSDVELASLKTKMASARILPGYIKTIIDVLPPQMGMMEAVRTAVSALGTHKFGWKPEVEQGIELTSQIASIIAYWHRKTNHLKPVEPDSTLSHVENYLYMLKGERPTPASLKALEAYMILTLEHGMNASTFSARVIASTESDMVSAITGAIGAMKGPLHGGAPTGIISMLDEIKTEDRAQEWLRNKLDRNERIMGFGHRVYKARDPRAQALSEIANTVNTDDHWLRLASFVEKQAIKLLEEYKPGRRLYTNVEFYAAAVMKAIDMEPELFTPTFTASRVVGWSAHVVEQSEDNTIYRPESSYSGLLPANV